MFLLCKEIIYRNTFFSNSIKEVYKIIFSRMQNALKSMKYTERLNGIMEYMSVFTTQLKGFVM